MAGFEAIYYQTASGAYGLLVLAVAVHGIGEGMAPVGVTVPVDADIHTEFGDQLRDKGDHASDAIGR